MRSEKNFFAKFGDALLSIDCISDYIKKFSNFFRSYRFNNTTTAINYILGLLKCTKGEANMERMEEEVDKSEYRAYQQFITNSNWDCEGLMKAIAVESSELLNAQKQINNLPVGYIIDESGHLKKGNSSVGVSRQYSGVAGKVDNCQIGVYSSLVNENDATIINERLFLAKTWTEDKKRCEKAGIPIIFQTYKTKPALAIEMIKEDLARGVKFDWIGGDGLYGHSFELGKSLDELKLFFVLDVHKDEKVFLEEPIFEVPDKKTGRGRTPVNLKANIGDFRLDKITENLKPEDWKLEEIRNTTKGVLKLYVYKTEVWSWDTIETTARKRTLVITKTTEPNAKIKYSFSNGSVNEYNHKEYAYFVSQRYWVERTFDNAKNELGMSDYQVRKWKSWHHHHSLVMLASLFIMKQKMELKSQIPLLSFRDARILVILQVFGTENDVKIRLLQMEKRHKKRQNDIDLSYKKQSNIKKNLTS
jgi:SRSO17 transposase